MNTGKLTARYIDRLIELALVEDSGDGDITSEILIPAGLQGRAYMLVKEQGVLAGINVVERVFKMVDSTLNVEIKISDGARVDKGDIIMHISGSVPSLLKAERVALNFIQRLSGIATTTARYIDRVQGLNVDIADTRKTTPGLRLLEKYAVRMGGGRNHRLNLSDAILIKDNHVAALQALGLSYREIVSKARAQAKEGIKVEAEARTVEEAVEAVEVGVDIVMLDNMAVADMGKAVKLIAGRAEIEASGGITLESVRSVAETGVDFISVGALTHSYDSLDISLEIEPGSFMLA